MKDQSINHPGILVGLLVDGRFLKDEFKMGEKRCNRSKEKKKFRKVSYHTKRHAIHCFGIKKFFVFPFSFLPHHRGRGKRKDASHFLCSRTPFQIAYMKIPIPDESNHREASP